MSNAKIFFLQGLLVLWLSSLLLSSYRRNQILYIALELITIGIAGEVASLKSFLINQFFRQNVDNGQQISEDIAERRADFWEYAAKFFGMFTSWAFVSGLSWNQTFMVTFIVVTVSYFLFCCGSSCYIRVNPTRETANSRIMQARSLLVLIPLCLTFVPYSLVEASGNTLFIVQSYRLDTGINPRISIDSFNRIPITSLYLFYTLISSIVSMSYNFLFRKLWGSEESIRMRHRAGFVRMGIGMLLHLVPPQVLGWWRFGD